MAPCATRNQSLLQEKKSIISLLRAVRDCDLWPHCHHLGQKFIPCAVVSLEQVHEKKVHFLQALMPWQDDFCNISVKTYAGFSLPVVGNQHFYKEKWDKTWSNTSNATQVGWSNFFSPVFVTTDISLWYASLRGQKHCLEQRTSGKLMDLHLVCMPSSLHPPCSPLLGNTSLDSFPSWNFCFLPWLYSIHFCCP